MLMEPNRLLLHRASLNTYHSTLITPHLSPLHQFGEICINQS